MGRPTVNVGVTGVHIAAAPRAGAVVAKELATIDNVRPIALADYPQTCALGWERLLHSVFLVPQGVLGGSALRDRILAVHSEIRLDVILPCDDDDVAAIADVAHDLASEGIAALVPPLGVVQSTTKEALHDTLTEAGVPVADQVVLHDIEESSIAAVVPPVVVKGRLMHAHLARTPGEVRAFARQISDVWGFPIVLQAAVYGAEFSVAAVADRASRIAGICAIRKLGISDQGKTWLATTIDPGEFGALVQMLVTRLQWVGPIEVEFIAQPDASRPVVIEINPRFPAWIRVSRHSGADLVRLALDLAQGRPSKAQLTAISGMCFARSYRTSTFPVRSMARLFAQGEVRFSREECA